MASQPPRGYPALRGKLGRNSTTTPPRFLQATGQAECGSLSSGGILITRSAALSDCTDPGATPRSVPPITQTHPSVHRKSAPRFGCLAFQGTRRTGDAAIGQQIERRPGWEAGTIAAASLDGPASSRRGGRETRRLVIDGEHGLVRSQKRLGAEGKLPALPPRGLN